MGITRRKPGRRGIGTGVAPSVGAMSFAPGGSAVSPNTPEVPDVATAPHPAPIPETDRLVTRPDEALPTALDPAGPRARGYPAYPNPVPKEGQGDSAATDPAPDDIGRSA